VEKNQYDLCLEVLKRLGKAGILEEVILIGSWCIPFYKDSFHSLRSLGAIKTRDIDLLVPAPLTTKIRVDLPGLMKDLGFIIGFKGTEGYIRLEHPDLIIEFLAPEKGRGSDKPVPLPQFGLNAQALRFLDLLIQHTIKAKTAGFEIRLPHPINFALQKMVISKRRTQKEKSLKDRNAAIDILRAMAIQGEAAGIKSVFNSMPLKWKKKVVLCIEEANERDLLRILK